MRRCQKRSCRGNQRRFSKLLVSSLLCSTYHLSLPARTLAFNSFITPKYQASFTSSLIHYDGAEVKRAQSPDRELAVLYSTASGEVDNTDKSPNPPPKSNGDAKKNSNAKAKLSRPERKALERSRKQDHAKNGGRGKRKHNYGARGKALVQDRPGEGPYDLHSNAIPRLTKESTADDVMKAIKRAQNMHDVHDIRHIENFLLEEVDETFAYGYRGSLLARLSVAALHMANHNLARRAIDARREQHRESMLPLESSGIIRGLLRVHNVTDAMFILEDELSVPDEGETLDDPENQERIKHRALALASVASRHFYEGEPSMAVKACQMLAKLGPIVRMAGLTSNELRMPWTRIVQGAAQCESGRRDGSVTPCLPESEVPMPRNLVYSVLDAMTTFPSDNNDKTYEALSNALVRRTLFVTGAVDMVGCPAADRGEAVFIGRSNVGKSSLVNMVTNRKSLAYTSKRPGKTQQFNFFAVNDKPEREREIKYGDVIPGERDADSFYIVDLPGFGFAKVPQQQRQAWTDLFTEYIGSRKTLKVVFHLVDARHGPTDEDERIMKQIGETLSKNVKYVVVLTKADKNVKGASTKNSGRVTKSVLEKLRETMKLYKVGSAPAILTSSETKLGRDDMWRYLRLAAES
uniref:EngB-type G domain-containing protein n=1 Tax=Odontella aurita TaxID=265563 RepID=A0A7S4JVK0_9STRA|mmetsp:Transcript_55253/g.165575  ORF Transcript_55253/g.165575 Transcript_55253/m.165575 type:complete len:635 (+) Transcript_55253:243-2147(+)